MSKPLIAYAGRDDTPQTDRMTNTERLEEVLSYLIGLAPVGQLFEIPRAYAMADLGICEWTFYVYLRELINQRYVKRFSCGASGSTGVLVVLRRMENA